MEDLTVLELYACRGNDFYTRTIVIIMKTQNCIPQYFGKRIETKGILGERIYVSKLQTIFWYTYGIIDSFC